MVKLFSKRCADFPFICLKYPVFLLGNHSSLTYNICVTDGAESIPTSYERHLAEALAMRVLQMLPTELIWD